jgi:oligopeptide transport system substrate-binding protein
MPEPGVVFLSHAKVDHPFAERLAEDLRQRGATIWIAPESIHPSEDWVSAIDRALVESSAMVVVLTPAAIQSAWVRGEVNAAIDRAMRGEMQLLFLNVRPTEATPLWRRYQWIDARTYSPSVPDQVVSVLGIESSSERVVRLARQARDALWVGQWQHALGLLEQIRKLDPQFTDPEGIAARARQGLQIDQQIALLYQQARDARRAGDWQRATSAMAAIHKLHPQFADPEGIAAAAREGMRRVNAEMQKPVQRVSPAGETVAPKTAAPSAATQRQPKVAKPSTSSSVTRVGLTILVVLGLVFVLLWVASSLLSNEQPTSRAFPLRGGSLALNLGTEPPTIDPALATDTTSVQCDEMFFLGLTDYDDVTSDIVPELATEWSVSTDGLVWTFKLRKDVEWVQYDPASKKITKKGPVTAKDIVYGVKRTVNPATASDYAYVDYIIKNAQAINEGRNANLDSLGVRAIDDYTVEFTLVQPAGYFPGIAGLWVNRPQPQAAIEAGDDKWTEPGNIWTNGPYMLDVWEHESKMVMVKNPHYYGARDVSIEKINCAMVAEESTAFAMYENGELDVCAVPSADMARVKADATLSKELHTGPRLCTYYYGFNTSKPPFDNVKVRQAFSCAIDRQKLIDTVLKGGQRPAKSFAPPGIFGNVADDPNFRGILFDAAKAKALLAEAGYPGGKGLPEITLMFNTSEGHQYIAQFVQQNLRDNLGIDVKLVNQEWAVYLKTVNGDDTPQIYRMGWCADYPDQNNWVLENFHTTKSLNNPKWTGPGAAKFDQLVEQAAAAADPEARKKAYFETEKLLVEEEAVIAPLYYYTSVVCTKPYVQRTYAPMGGEHIDQWKIMSR